MRKLVLTLFAVGAAAYAGPITVTGTFLEGNNSLDLNFSGPAISFSDNNSFIGPTNYMGCANAGVSPCDLSDSFVPGQPGVLGQVLATIDGQAIVACPGANCGMAGGDLTITASPYLFGSNSCQPVGAMCSTPNIPITVNGDVWAASANGARLFDWAMAGSGMMSATFFDAGGSRVEVVSISGSFSAQADPVPEPGTWVLVCCCLPAAASLRRRRGASRPAARS